MPTTYSRADDDIIALLTKVMHEYHRDLEEAGVLVGVVAATNPSGDAVKHHGSPAFATIRVVSPKDRVSKGTDAELLLDADKWEELRPRQRLAALYWPDHEVGGWACRRCGRRVWCFCDNCRRRHARLVAEARAKREGDR